MPETDLAVRDDIANDVRATLESLKTDAPPPEPIVETIQELPPEVGEEEKPARDDNRDELGRFKAKEPAAASSIPEPAQRQQPAEPDLPQRLTPPAKWDPEAKAAFLAAPAAIQKQILAREEQAEKSRSEWEPKAQTHAQIEQVLAPHRARWAAQGVNDAQAIAYLAQAQAQLDQDPIAGLAQIAQSYGITPQQLLARLSGQQPEGGEMQQRPTADPRVDQLVGYIRQKEAAERQAQIANVQDEITKFSTDPANVYFENVRDHMAVLIKSHAERGAPIDLKTAYEMATWADPKVRKLIMAADSAKAAENAARSAATQRAKQAGVQTVGDPGTGVAAPKNPSNPTEDVRGDVIAAIKAARSQA